MFTPALTTLFTLLLTTIIPAHVAATTSMVQVQKCDSPELCPSSDGPWQSFKIEVQLDAAMFLNAAIYPSFYMSTSLLASSTSSNIGDKIGTYSNASVSFDYLAGLFTVNTPEPIDVSKELFDHPRVDGLRPHKRQVGELGLGPMAYVFENQLNYTPGITEVLFKKNFINSASWSMHLGSATHGPLNSLIVGGYDQSRVVGDVGVFDIVLGVPRMFLVDIALGVEEGASPFSSELGVEAQRDKSVWQSLGDIATGSGAAYGASVMNFSTVLPGIYLPLDNCAAIAKHLPVVWRQDLEYYAWNTSDEMYQRMISSPAYVAFVLSDRSAKNITLKVPLLLLNLTLEAPFTDLPTAYFPCRPSKDNTTMLGRAVLQSAFVGVAYNLSLAYAAQAPGPGAGQFLAANFPRSDTESLHAQPAASFARSWASKWTPLVETNQTARGGSNGSDGTHGLSSGAIAGIAIGVVMAAVIVGVSVWIIWKSRRKTVTRPREDSRVTVVAEFDATERPATKVQEGADVSCGRPAYELAGT